MTPGWIGRRLLAAALAVGALAGVAGCSPDDQVETRQSSETLPSEQRAGSRAAPFKVSPVPDGLTVSAVVDGDAEPRFSDDSFGGTKPSMVIVPDDWTGLDDHRWIVIMSIDGSGNEGGFYQELPAYTRSNENEGRLVIDGHPAVKWPSQGIEGEPKRRTAAFVAINTSTGESGDLQGGTQRGLLITGTVEDLDLLETVAQAAGDDAGRTPTLRKAPNGWQVLGTLSASQASNTDEGAIEYQPEGRNVVLLGDPAGREVWVTAFEGNATTPILKAIETMWHPYDLGTFGDTHEFSIDGADAALIACCDGDGPAAIATAWFSLDGSPFSVHGPASLVGTPDLASRFASSIVLTTANEWAATKRPPRTTTTNQGTGNPTTSLLAPATVVGG